MGWAGVSEEFKTSKMRIILGSWQDKMAKAKDDVIKFAELMHNSANGNKNEISEIRWEDFCYVLKKYNDVKVDFKRVKQEMDKIIGR